MQSPPRLSLAGVLLNAEALRAHPYDPDDDLWSRAEAESVHLLLLDNARAAGVDAAWTETSATRGRAASHRAAAVALMRDRELIRLLGLIAESGCSCVLMKGAALAHTHYAQPHLRPRSDTDVLIRHADRGKVLGILQAARYESAVESCGELVTSQLHVDRADAPSGLYALDLHWRVANPRLFTDIVTVEACFQEAVHVPALGPHARVLSATHALFVACVHRVAHHQDDPALLWLWDIHLLLESLEDEEVERFASLAVHAGMAAVCARSLELTHACFGSERAQELSIRLMAARDGAEPSATFIGGGLRQVDLAFSDLRALHSWPERLTLIREHLIPPASYIRAKYARWPAVFLPFAYLHRMATGSFKWFRRAPRNRPPGML